MNRSENDMFWANLLSLSPKDQVTKVCEFPADDINKMSDSVLAKLHKEAQCKALGNMSKDRIERMGDVTLKDLDPTSQWLALRRMSRERVMAIPDEILVQLSCKQLAVNKRNREIDEDVWREAGYMKAETLKVPIMHKVPHLENKTSFDRGVN